METFISFLISENFKIVGFKYGLAKKKKKNIGNIKINIDFYNKLAFML